MASEIMTLQETAGYLKVTKQTIYRMLNAKQIPAFKVRSEWRFRKEAIDAWIEQGAPERECREQDTSETDWFDIPVLGPVAAGRPILAEENIEGTVRVAKDKLRSPTDVFALRVKGDSMVNAKIYDCDTVLIHAQPTVENGEIAAVIIEGESTLKRVFKTADGKIRLQPENDTMKPTVVDPSNKEFRIAGKMMMVMSQVQKRSESIADVLTKDEIFRRLKAHQDILDKYKVRRIGLFGSYARGDQTPSSDIDFIVDFDLTRFGENFKGLYKAFNELSDYLEGLFKRKVEILTPDSVKTIRIKEVKDAIERSVIYV